MPIIEIGLQERFPGAAGPFLTRPMVIDADCIAAQLCHDENARGPRGYSTLHRSPYSPAPKPYVYGLGRPQGIVLAHELARLSAIPARHEVPPWNLEPRESGRGWQKSSAIPNTSAPTYPSEDLC